jgi:hypothetical protein
MNILSSKNSPQNRPSRHAYVTARVYDNSSELRWQVANSGRWNTATGWMKASLSIQLLANVEIGLSFRDRMHLSRCLARLIEIINHS